MKTILTSLLAIFVAAFAIAQCDAPIVENWNANDPANATIEFTAPPGSQSYELTVSVYYGLFDGFMFDDVIFGGDIKSGSKTIALSVVGLTISPYNSFFSSKLSVICANGDVSAVNHFYFSPYSLLNDPGINIGDLFFKPLTPLPDLISMPFDT